MKTIIRVVLIIKIMVIIISSTIQAESNPKLRLLVYLNNDNVKGKISSIIIPLRDRVFLFNENGTCVKKVNFNPSEGTVRFSRNHKYMSIVEFKEKKYYINLMRYDGKILWSTSFSDPLSVIGISNDAKRVFVRLSTQDETDFPITKCLNEKGKEIISLSGVEIVQTSIDYAISDSGLYWICRSFNIDEDKWLFYCNRGNSIELIKTQQINGNLNSLGDNGNILIEKKGNSILLDFKFNPINHYSNFTILSQSGQVLFYSNKSFFFFEEQNKITKINKDLINKACMGKQRIFYMIENNFERDGDFVVAKLDSNSELILLFLYKNGSFSINNIDIDWDVQRTDYCLINQENYLAILDSEENICKVYLVDGEKK